MCVSHSGVRLNGTSHERKGKVFPHSDCKVTNFPNKHKTQSQKLFISSKFIRTIHQHFTPPRAKNSSTISKKQRPSQQNSTALFTDATSGRTSYSPPLFCPFTRAYAHSANFRFLPSPFTDHRISLILGELGVKAMPSIAFTRLKSFLLTRRGQKNTVSEGLIFRFWLPSPLPSPSTSCISNQCRAPTLFFEVKEIGRAFTLFVHLSHRLSTDTRARDEEVKAKNGKTPDARVRARKKGENEEGNAFGKGAGAANIVPRRKRG